MKNKIILTLIIFLLSVYNVQAETKPYWVFFTDRGQVNIERAVAAKISSPSEPKNTCRRARVIDRKKLFDERDLPVNPDYIAEVEKIAGNLRTVTRYFNGVSADLDEEVLKTVKSLPFVKFVTSVKRFKRPDEPEQPGAFKSGGIDKDENLSYGNSFDQLNMIGVIGLHNLGYLGEGIRIAILDSGFDNLEHTAFESICITDTWDFVEGDDDPAGDDHGSKVLSIMAAMDEEGNKNDDYMIGAAPYATYILARTEIDEGEDQRIEEDYWVAGLEWAESLGADIVNSSLGYIDFEDGYSYKPEDLDGETAVTTIAADIAVEKGVVVVTSAGNEGDNEEWHYKITTPADGDGVIAVGSVNINGVISLFSSHGPTYDGRIKPDFAALGENVMIIDPTSQMCYNSGYGTSYSAPSVSGAIALILESNPLWTPEKVRQALRDTAIDRGIAGPDTLYGYGIINALAASGLEEKPEPPVSVFKADPPYPQPFNFKNGDRAVFFPVEIPSGGTLSVRIFNFSGENVKSIETNFDSAGSKYDRTEAPSWDGTNFTGDDVAPGIYYYTIKFGYGGHTGKIAVIR